MSRIGKLPITVPAGVDVNITGTNVKWYDAPINGNTLAETTLLESKIYYITQTLNNCESERYAVTVKIQDTQIPNADSPQQFCIQKNAKISDIAISGQNINWLHWIIPHRTLHWPNGKKDLPILPGCSRHRPGNHLL